MIQSIGDTVIILCHVPQCTHNIIELKINIVIKRFSTATKNCMSNAIKIINWGKRDRKVSRGNSHHGVIRITLT